MFVHKLKYILIVWLICSQYAAESQSCTTDLLTHYSYRDIKTILDKNQCNSCHHKSSALNTWHYETYEAMTGQSACRTPVIIPGNINQSLLVDKLNGGWVECGNAMPPGGKSISAGDLFAIEQWILSGAPEFCIPSFNEIKSILQNASCGDCHNQQGKWNLSSYQHLGGALYSTDCNDHKIIHPHQASKSLLYTKLSIQTLQCGAPMPLDRPALDYLSIAKIRDWINAGAYEQAKALPVILESISLQEYQDGHVRLFWETSSELNTAYFEVQHSQDGIRFNPAGRVSARGGINKKVLYSFDYDQQRTGYNYYRLRMVDLDGDFTYSQIRVSFVKNVSEIYTIFPNPVGSGEQLVLEWLPTDDRQKVRASLMDFTGRLHFENIIHTGINHITLPDLSPGVYYLTIKDYNETYKVERVLITGR
jgi:hypothetical protein